MFEVIVRAWQGRVVLKSRETVYYVHEHFQKACAAHR
jgi:hypothetical protein